MGKSKKEMFDEFKASIVVPEGFTMEGEFFENDKPYSDSPTIKLKSEDVKIKMPIYFDAQTKKGVAPVISISGTTNYKAKGTWFTFDRVGVESSFYVIDEKAKYAYGEPLELINEVVEQQIKRAKEAMIKTAKTVQVPVIGFHISPERKAEITKALKSGKSQSLTPSGFGTGFHLIPKVVRGGQWGPKAAAVSLKKFFDVPVLYVETMDCD